MTSSVSSDTKNLVLDLVRTNSPRPSELLEQLHDTLSYHDVQDALAVLLDSGQIEMGPDRRLHVPQVAA
jgi:hypothetical protein